MAKRLYRSRNDYWMGGVCGGIAEYFNIDATLVRLGLIVFGALGGSGLVAYIIAWCVIPEAPKNKSAKQRAKADNYAAYAQHGEHEGHHHEGHHDAHHNQEPQQGYNRDYDHNYDDRSNGPRV
ncbi:MAG: PspC domain-containing protein [Defluviitaleaceae bacterium]|nr:PspC domain-containing protein [Defluviitaleaceae bacterium]